MSACVALAMDCANVMALAVRARCRVLAQDYIGAKADLDLMPSHDETLCEVCSSRTSIALFIPCWYENQVLETFAESHKKCGSTLCYGLLKVACNTVYLMFMPCKLCHANATCRRSSDVIGNLLSSMLIRSWFTRSKNVNTRAASIQVCCHACCSVPAVHPACIFVCPICIYSMQQFEYICAA